MKPLRWKKQYASADPAQDAENRALTQCLNTLLEASRQRDHCQEVEDLMGRMTDQTDRLLRAGYPRTAIEQALRPLLHNDLPLPTYASAACHDCGVCDMARGKLAAHLEAPARCFDTALLPWPKTAAPRD